MTGNQNHYQRLLLMTLFSFASMFVLMYAMVNAIGNVYSNVNQLYMAGLKTAPMLIIEMSLMRGMYRNGGINALIIAVSIVAGFTFFSLVRAQTAVSDRQFLRSMIPHHAGAILMCEEASVHGSEIRELCAAILSSQQAEIDRMKAKLRELESPQSRSSSR